MKTANVNTARRSCPAWCATHDDEGGVCLSALTEVAVQSPGPAIDTLSFADVSLAYCVEEDVSVYVTLGGTGTSHMHVDDAEKLADALRDMVAVARAAAYPSIPAPRAASDVDPVSGRDYAEEAWQRAEAEREGLAELAAEPLADENAAGVWFDDEPEDGAL